MGIVRDNKLITNKNSSDLATDGDKVLILLYHQLIKNSNSHLENKNTEILDSIKKFKHNKPQKNAYD